MSKVVEAVENAIKQLGLSKVAVRVSDEKAEAIYKSLISTFVTGGDRRWWWEAFKLPSASIEYEDGMGFKRISNFVPDKKEIVWFVVEDDQLPYYPIYEASTENVSSIISECFAFEYYLVPKDKSWLVCENHHNRVIGVGGSVISAIESASM